MSRWVVVISGKQYINELCKAPDDVLSFNEPSIEATQGDYTLGPGLLAHPHHIATIRSSVTRNLGVKFGDIKDEVVESFKTYITPTNEGWATVPGYETLLHVVCRTINRYLIGLPLCRNPRYRFINEQFTNDTVTTAKIISMFPNFLKPLVGKCLTTVAKKIGETEKLLRPLIEERLMRRQQSENSPDAHNDVISWLMGSATKDYHLSVRDIVLRILIINFTAVHTSTMGLVQSVYDLAIHPEYVTELREEIEMVIAEDGWSRQALQKMHKVDSFLKESFRLHNAAAFLMVRKTRKDWRFSDGTTIPPNVYVGVATEAMNKEEAIYQDAHKFNGFRFVPQKLSKSDTESKHDSNPLVSLSSEYIVFGNGRHACPGRFLAANTVKTVFTYIVLNYDVQLENGSLKRPPNIRFGTSIIPNQEAKLMFRKRVED
ncbi:hypothetical protein AGABI1DRAFT_125670 [Agaricus bisporus var. burnettii JB137-S8]|uniref:Cytochrome P450 n=1 Tax=Agaricus bisporus var. burnettii (strain JB137-S8 / ATCC MYA-4627 / FGSC 10392) TaxID=597362 RepID=K5X5R4_AGABU|nr:uncharacterized protein AGABI1DRAFT_125670 [Agaricus bisporus var. burnettii JB137-S8]EKM83196.1 hypothetical protein AGABI1DRAFT_125670 [Agaricus bisporus var. burnettii JB137-S8]